MGFQIALWKFHKNGLNERFLEGKAVTVWDELTEHKAVSQETSFQFLSSDISLGAVFFNGIRNNRSQIPQESV